MRPRLLAFDDLPRVPREDADRLSAWARAAPTERLEALAADAAAWLGAPLALDAGVPTLDGALPDDWPTALLVAGEARAALAFAPAVAAALIERTLGGDGAVEAAAGPLRDIERGVLAYAVARWLAGSGWTLTAVLGRATAAEEALGARPVRWPLELALGDVTGPGLLAVAGPPPPAPPRDRALPIGLACVAGRAVLTASELASLRPGDVLVPDRLDVRAADAGWEGPVELRAGRGGGLRARLTGGALHYEGTIARGPATRGRRPRSAPEDPVDDDADITDIPVTLTLELGRFELPLAELARLSPGEVIATGRPLGAEVTLRAGDRAVATGELVEIDGELGVRLRAVST